MPDLNEITKTDGQAIRDAWADVEHQDAVSVLWCENCAAENSNMRYAAKLPKENLSSKDKAERWPATQIGIAPVRPEYKDRPPNYWCFCNSHGQLALIAGFNPAHINSERGKCYVAALRARSRGE